MVARQASDEIGSVLALVLLRRAHVRQLPEHPSLAGFAIGRDARVAVQAGGNPYAPLPTNAIAAWAAAFLLEVDDLVEPPPHLDLEAALAPLRTELQAAGLLALLGQAHRRLAGDRRGSPVPPPTGDQPPGVNE
jgi:hypothetical protein